MNACCSSLIENSISASFERGLRTERAPRRLAACAGPPPHRGGTGFDNARIRGMTGHDYTPTANKSKNIFPPIPPNHPKRNRLG